MTRAKDISKILTDADISGNIDVDGTTNLDVVDVDGALTQDGGAVFNEVGADVDFRVESDTKTHALFVQGSDGAVGIGTATSPTGFLNVSGVAGSAFPATSGSTQSAGLIARLQQGSPIGSVMDIGGNGGGGSWIQVTEPTNLTANYPLLLNPNGGNVGIGTPTPSSTLEIKVASGNLQVKLAGATATHGIRNQADGSWGDFDYTNSRWMTLRDYSGDYYQVFTGGGTAAMKIHSNQVVSATGGVALGVGTANTASNVLDDYEEGTWTPAYTVGSNGYATQVGTYTKIGQLVTAWFFVQINNNQIGNNTLHLGSLPFTSSNSVVSYGATSTMHCNSWSSFANKPDNGLVAPNSTRIDLYHSQGTTGTSQPTGSNLGNGSLIGFVTYRSV